jgi:hypothetical protein
MRFASMMVAALALSIGGLPGRADAQALQGCWTNADCSNGLFCDGAERCVGASRFLGIRGFCVQGPAPCSSGFACNEATDRCELNCDADGDGVLSIRCGGADCDDNDPLRYPGAIEVCDPDGRDEDCNDRTVGDRDADGDGFISAECCNGSNCGTDCDDRTPWINPAAAEICGNGIDDNCNGRVDAEDAQDAMQLYADCDRDGFGDSRRSVMSCANKMGVNGMNVSVPWPDGQGSSDGCYLSPYDGDPNDDDPDVVRPKVLPPQEPFPGFGGQSGP